MELDTRGFNIDVDSIKAWSAPAHSSIGEFSAIGDIPSFYLGWGSSGQQQLALRKRVGKPGSPWGGLGFYDPQLNAADAREPEPGPPPADLTAEVVKAVKLEQFRNCAHDRSMYFPALHPIYDDSNRVMSAEILARLRNGTDTAPYEDISALLNPAAEIEVQRTYAMWKVAEIGIFGLDTLKNFPIFRNMIGIFVNVRPMDMNVDSMIYKGLLERLGELTPEDRDLLVAHVGIEVTEDQEHPEDLPVSLKAWRDLGFVLSYDDTIGAKARDALKIAKNCHTPEVLVPLIDHFTHIKIDMEWAGHCIFLSHPALRPPMKAEVLRHAADEDKLFVAKGSVLVDTGASYSELLAEFAQFCKDMFAFGRILTIELTVVAEDPNNAHALGKLKELGIDVLGEHKGRFLFQGGPTLAKAFTPEVLAGAVVPAGP